MQTLIRGGKYQILEVIEARDGYKLCLCIDVETDNQYRPLIFNIYEKAEYIRRFLPVFYEISREKNSDFVRLMTEPHSVIAAFEYHRGEGLKNFFKRIDKNDFKLRVQYASLLLEKCLVLDTMDDFIALSCLEPDRIVVSEQSQRVMINYFIRPELDAAGESKGVKLAALLECIFIKNRYVPEELWDYIDGLRQNKKESIVSAFSKWKEIAPSLLKTHEKYKKETFAAYLFRKFKRLLKIKRKALNSRR